MILDQEIKLDGVAATIKRTAGDLNTYIYYGHIGRLGGKGDPDNAHEAGYYLPTDSGAVSGDLLLIDGDYYLLMSIEKVFSNGIKACYRGKLYKCNSTVTIYGYNTSSGKSDTVIAQNVRCLIVQEGTSGVLTDKAMVIKEYKGKTTPYQLYLRASEGLVDSATTPRIEDQDGNKFDVLDDFNPITTDGIIQARVKINE